MEIVSGILRAKLFELSGNPVTLSSLLASTLMIVVAVVLAWLARRFLDRLRRSSSPTASSGIYLAGRIVGYAIVFIGITTASSTLGFDVSTLTIFAGAIGVGLGLGLQDIVKNFLSGLVLMLDRSIEVGDFVELEDGVAGEVVAIGARATTIITNDRVDIVLPNSVLIENRLTNWTRNQTSRRVRIPFSVAYGYDKEIVRAAALDGM